jgi:hypothetical protein
MIKSPEKLPPQGSGTCQEFLPHSPFFKFLSEKCRIMINIIHYFNYCGSTSCNSAQCLFLNHFWDVLWGVKFIDPITLATYFIIQMVNFRDFVTFTKFSAKPNSSVTAALCENCIFHVEIILSVFSIQRN